jgi:hypothetical protein
MSQEVAVPQLLPREYLEHPAEETARRTQTFFAQLAAETSKPHYGGRDRELVLSLLLRAQEAGLYRP